MSTNYKLNLSLFFLGFLGVLTLLLAPIPAAIPEEVIQEFSESTFKLLMLANPTVLLIITVFLGGKLAHKFGLDAPTIRNALNGKPIHHSLQDQLRSGIPIGLLAGVLITGYYVLCQSFFSPEMMALSKQEELHILTRFLYGGVTEEILLRWGFMSLFVWMGWKISKSNNAIPSNRIFWISILITAILFGILHLPIVYASLTEVNSFVIFYIITGNMILGIPAGWLFWKKGLEAAMIAHLFGHVGMLSMGLMMS